MTSQGGAVSAGAEDVCLPITDRRVLTELLRSAFLDGFECGADHGNLAYKYPPANIAWRISETRASVTGETQTLKRDWYKIGNVTDEEIIL